MDLPNPLTRSLPLALPLEPQRLEAALRAGPGVC